MEYLHVSIKVMEGGAGACTVTLHSAVSVVIKSLAGVLWMKRQQPTQ